jgi:hypothetical protein
MPAQSSVAYGPRYVVTPQGHRDLTDCSTCDCHIRLTGLLVECPDCGTIYGYTRDSAMASSLPQAKRA